MIAHLSNKIDADVQLATQLFVVRLARKWLDAEQVVLFGSRAKGTNSVLSDYDFAIFPSREARIYWPNFWNEVDECAPTLNKIDLVDLSSKIRPQLRSEIESTGIVLWSISNNEQNETY